MSELDDILTGLPGAELISAAQKKSVLDRSVIPDSNGAWPGDSGYETTVDYYFAAYILVGWLKAQPVVTNVNSEGTGVTVQAPDWHSLLQYYMSMSPILQTQGNGVLGFVEIPDGPHVVKTNMKDKGQDYGDIDTDVS